MIYVPEGFYEYGDTDFLVALTLLHIKSSDSNVIYTTTDIVLLNIYDNVIEDKNIRHKISASLKNLCEQIDGRNIYFISTSRLKTKGGEHFARLYYEDVRKIMQSDYKNKMFMLRHYALMMKSVNNETNVGNMSVKYFETKLGCSKSSILRSNSRLEELGVIYVYHSSTIKNGADGEIYSESNIYGNIRDVGAIKDAGENVAPKDCGVAKSLGNKYAWLKRGKIYPDEVVQQIYDYCVEYNKKLAYNKSKDKDYAGQYKDLTIFEGYNIKRDIDLDMF